VAWVRDGWERWRAWGFGRPVYASCDRLWLRQKAHRRPRAKMYTTRKKPAPSTENGMKRDGKNIRIIYFPFCGFARPGGSGLALACRGIRRLWRAYPILDASGCSSRRNIYRHQRADGLKLGRRPLQWALASETARRRERISAGVTENVSNKENRAKVLN